VRTRLARFTTTSRLPLVLVVALLAAGLSGCGLDYRTTIHNVSQDDLAAGAEPYFNVGPLTYQVQITRQLNPFATEDVSYLAGISNAQTLPGDRLWFGVFLWAKNQSGHPQITAGKFEIVDSSGAVYQPTKLNPSLNPFAWTQQRLDVDATEPGVDTTAWNGPTGGSLILFDLPTTVYSNRPLTLRIFPPGGGPPSRVSLDL
jgi:hypothetical protein